MGSRKDLGEMSGKKRTPEEHRFAVEDLLDLYASVHESNGALVESKTNGARRTGSGRPTRTSTSPETVDTIGGDTGRMRISGLPYSRRKKA
jgi:hypothetical protein